MIDNGSTEVRLNDIFKTVIIKIFRNLKTFFLFLISLSALTFLFLTIPQPKYFLTYSISSNYLSGQKIELIYSDVKKMISLKQYQTLSALLNLPVEEIMKIKDFKIEVDEPSAALISNNDFRPDFHFNETNTTFKILMSDTTNSASIVPALNNFLTGSNYFKKIKKNELITIEKINQQLEIEKKELDSINQINLRKFTQSTGSMLLMNDLSQIKQNIYNIEERLINNKRGLIMLEDPVNIISHPIVYKQSIIMNFLVAAIKALALVSLVFLVLSTAKWIRRTYTEFKLNS